jgi:uncharacterized membrane protein
MLVIRILRGRPFLFISVLAGLAISLVLPRTLAHHTRALMSWDVGCLVFLVLSACLFGAERDMARDAAAQEEGEWTVFAVVIGAMVASLGALLSEFAKSHGAPPEIRGLLIGLVVVTLLLSWLSTHTMFALRYAHEYYSTPRGADDVEKGLQFPGDQPPDYWDFLYFALVLGMTFQVSDVQITSRKLRRLATVHGFLSFMFSTVVLALTVNLAAALIQPS